MIYSFLYNRQLIPFIFKCLRIEINIPHAFYAARAIYYSRSISSIQPPTNNQI